jgi:hypothetical protein
MAKSKRRKTATTYARLLREDRYVQDQLRKAASGLAQAYQRVSRQRGKAAEDRKLYEHLRESASSARRAALALQRKRAEPSHRGRNVVIAALAGGGTAVVISKRSKLRSLVARGPDEHLSSEGPERTAQPAGEAANAPRAEAVATDPGS